MTNGSGPHSQGKKKASKKNGNTNKGKTPADRAKAKLTAGMKPGTPK